MTIPNKDQIYPLKHYDRLVFIKNIIKEIGDYTYYDDFEDEAVIAAHSV